MKNPKININKLAISLKGVDTDLARVALAGLGEELLAKLGEHKDVFKTGRVINVDSMDLGIVKFPIGQDSHQLKSEIVNVVTQAIVKAS